MTVVEANREFAMINGIKRPGASANKVEVISATPRTPSYAFNGRVGSTADSRKSESGKILTLESVVKQILARDYSFEIGE